MSQTRSRGGAESPLSAASKRRRKNDASLTASQPPLSRPGDILWDYYLQNKPTNAPEEIHLPEIYERDSQLEGLARDAEYAFSAYKSRSDDRRSYVLPVCYGASGCGKTTLGKLMLRDLAKVVANVELKALLEERCQHIFVNFNGGGDTWNIAESRKMTGGEILDDSDYNIALGVRLFARGILQQTADDLLRRAPVEVLREMTVANVLRLTGQVLRGSRESTEDVAVVIHMDEYQLIESDDARLAMMSALAGYRITSFKDRVFVMVLFTGTSLQAAERGFSSDKHIGFSGFNSRYFELPPLTLESAMRVVSPSLMEWPPYLLSSPEVRSVIDDLGGLPGLLQPVGDKDLLKEMSSIPGEGRSPKDVAAGLADVIKSKLIDAKRTALVFSATFEQNPVALQTLLYIVISGLPVQMWTKIDKEHQVQDFDRGGLFTIEPVRDTSETGEVRLRIPFFLLNALGRYMGNVIPWLHDYQDLFPFPSFTRSPERLEAAAAAVLAARLNALYNRKRQVATMAEIFPGCTMTSMCRSREVQLAPNSRPLREARLGDVTRGSSRFLGENVWISDHTTQPLGSTEGLVLRRFQGAKCVDVHFVLARPNKTKAHFAIQCKSGASTTFDALQMYQEAMAFMAPVEGMDHYFVLAALHTGKVRRPPMDQWPDNLIVVDSFAEFVPLMRALV